MFSPDRTRRWCSEVLRDMPCVSPYHKVHDGSRTVKPNPNTGIHPEMLVCMPTLIVFVHGRAVSQLDPRDGAWIVSLVGTLPHSIEMQIDPSSRSPLWRVSAAAVTWHAAPLQTHPCEDHKKFLALLVGLMS